MPLPSRGIQRGDWEPRYWEPGLDPPSRTSSSLCVGPFGPLWDSFLPQPLGFGAHVCVAGCLWLPPQQLPLCLLGRQRLRCWSVGGVSALPLPPLLLWKSSSRLGGFRPSWLVVAALAKRLRPPAGKRLNPKFTVFRFIIPSVIPVVLPSVGPLCSCRSAPVLFIQSYTNAPALPFPLSSPSQLPLAPSIHPFAPVRLHPPPQSVCRLVCLEIG